jgi:protein TonB
VRLSTLVLSAVFHVGLAVGLVAFAQQRELRKHRAISVAVADAKKKEAKPKPPPPPKPIARPAPAKVTSVAKAEPSHAAAPVHAAPVATNLTMANSDSDTGPGIGLHGPAPKATTAAAPTKVASAISEKRVKRAEEAAAGGDAPCTEEPTKPEPVVKTEINYALYPQAQADGVEGKIKIRFVVGVDGEVERVDVISGIEPGLDAAIVAAAQRWRFKPAMACGKPVAGGTYVFQARFELGN